MSLILGERGDLPRQYFLKLLESVSASVRARLEASNPDAAREVRDTIDEVATEMQREARESSHEFSAAARSPGARCGNCVRAKRRLQADDFGRLCERYQKLGQETARSIVSFYKKRVELRSQNGAPGEAVAV